MPVDLSSLPKIRDSVAFLYIEHAVIEQDNFSIVLIRADGKVPVPIKAFTCLLLGPGTSITHAAIQSITKAGCSVVWCGENCRKFYAFGEGETRKSSRLLHQAAAWADHETHMKVVKAMYLKRFPDVNYDGLTLQQLRGLEGVRVKATYSELSKLTGVQWYGRHCETAKISSQDIVNQALTLANDYLYAVCEAVIRSMGYSCALGFIHTGNMRSFVFDIADLYKTEVSIPAAFEVASKRGVIKLSEKVRTECQKRIHSERILKRMADDLSDLFGDIAPDDVYFVDVNELWDKKEYVIGSKNYAALYGAEKNDEEENSEW